MKIHLVLTEGWSQMKQSIKDAEEYLGMFGVSVTTERKGVDVANPALYETNLSFHMLGIQLTKSLKPAFIYGLADPKYLAADCLGILLDKAKAIEEEYLWGQQEKFGTHEVMEIYCQRSNAKRYGHKLDTYTLIHELLHALASHHGVQDTLHFYQDDPANKTLDAYRDILLERILDTPMGLLPRVQDAADKLVTYAASIGTPIRLVEGYRSGARQNELFNQVPKVTNAKAGESMHQYRVAFDVVFRNEGYNATPAQWKAIADYAKKLGLEWGGDWTTFLDKPHFEMTFGKSVRDFQKGNIDWSKYYDGYPSFNRDLYIGIEGEDVRALQKFLNAQGYRIALFGAGAPGLESATFGPATQRALIAFQKQNGIEPAAGFFGPASRAVLKNRYNVT